MAALILHKDGAYNIYGTIADGPHFESALTLEQLTEVIGQEFGEAGLRELPQRLERAHRTGCSSMRGETLEDCIACNRAGPNEANMPEDEFVRRYMTLPHNG
jgi:hypothetical protein